MLQKVHRKDSASCTTPVKPQCHHGRPDQRENNQLFGDGKKRNLICHRMVSGSSDIMKIQYELEPHLSLLV